MPGARLRLRFLFRWVLDRLHIFAEPGFGAVLIYDGDRLAHYSGFTPRYWRFPFIANGDFQIGDTWTDPAYRGKGLASAGLARAVALLTRPHRRLWYVVESINEPSIRVAEKGHFTLAAEGGILEPWGLGFARAYVIGRICADAERG
ncbi:MAG TPA: GNAT family N-acetyltransferase [Candidatus Binataceae bacterium]|nr:GNAT family N-acetyltransferase [Candidatus Binataceae bacterium]